MQQELIKASNVVHVSRKLTLVQQQIWNFMLAHAYDQLATKSIHSISISALSKYLGNTRNYQLIEKSLLDIPRFVNYSILTKDEEAPITGDFALLEVVWIDTGTCYYGYGKSLIPLLHNPRIYAKINLAVQRSFSSKHALNLYEHCVDYEGISSTPWLSVNKLKNLLGFEKDEYPIFKQFNAQVIKKAVKEINAKAEIDIQPEYELKSKSVSKIRFAVTKKNADLILEDETSQVAESTDDPLVDMLVEFGMPLVQAINIFKKFERHEIEQKINLLKKNSSAIRNPAGWIVSALANNWQPRARTFFERPKPKPVVPMVQKYNQFHVYELQREHNQYLDAAVNEIYQNLSTERQQELEQLFHEWIKKEALGDFGNTNIHRLVFLQKTLLSSDQLDFKTWVKNRGYEVERVGKEYKIVHTVP